MQILKEHRKKIPLEQLETGAANLHVKFVGKASLDFHQKNYNRFICKF